MKGYTFEIFDHKDQMSLIELEKKIYTAFVEKIPNNWVQSKYQIIDDNRLRPNISYNKQHIFLMKKENTIVSAIGLHFNTDGALELEDFGFKIDKTAICEGLFFFTDGPGVSKTIRLKEFVKYIIDFLKRKNIRYWYGTCDRSLTKLYKYFGCKVIDSTHYNESVIDLFRFEVS